MRYSSYFNTSTLYCLSAICVFLPGCHANLSTTTLNQSQSLPYKVAGASDANQLIMQDKLRQQGLQVITIGQDYMISVPSQVLFANQSPKITWPAYDVLNNVACFLKQYRKISVQVTSFSSHCLSDKRDRALTAARSRAVANYLWSQGIDSRFAFTEGLGSDKPIMAYSKNGDQSPNSRVEITFREAVI